MTTFENLTSEHIHLFKRDGVIVIDNILTLEEVEETRKKFHAHLEAAGVDHTDLRATGDNLASLSSTGGAGGILDIFWASFKLEVAEDPRIVRAISNLWEYTYATYAPKTCCQGLSAEEVSDLELWKHPYGEFDPRKPLLAVDRVCYRVPDVISKQLGKKRHNSGVTTKDRPLQRHLAPHLDCCPDNYDRRRSDTFHPRKWRPIQAFVALTDCLEPNHGGFECCHGFHHNFNKWVQDRHASIRESRDGQFWESPPPCIGEFTPIRPTEDADILSQFKHVPYNAGSLILWDNRIPHANSKFHKGNTPREVIYISLLPHVQENISYVEDQLKNFKAGSLPSDFWQATKDTVRQHAQDHNFTTLGKQLMGIEEYK